MGDEIFTEFFWTQLHRAEIIEQKYQNRCMYQIFRWSNWYGFEISPTIFPSRSKASQNCSEFMDTKLLVVVIVKVLKWPFFFHISYIILYDTSYNYND